MPPTLVSLADIVAVPKATMPNATGAESFTLHAPLELMARVGLLPYVAAADLPDALDGVAALVDRYRAAGDPVGEPDRVSIDSIVHGARLLLDALAAGDGERTDAVAVSLLPMVGAEELAALVGPAVVTSLAAAGHAPIGLALLHRLGSATAAPFALPTTLMRGPLRSLAARPEWQLDWFNGVDSAGDPSQLYDALRAVPRLGRPGSDFIHPLMSQVQDSGVARVVLGPVLPSVGARFDMTAAARTLSRVAAWSMLHDDPEQAPYGWTHAMTMPQAVMALANAGVDARTAYAVATTFLVGFRAAHAQVDLPTEITAGSAPQIAPHELALAASLHEDAHVVKFTLACLHSTEDDSAFGPLYLSAAGHLLEWWCANGDGPHGG
ncbi:MAG: hypothetical protein WCI22_02640 [Actinomycetota bacterium]